MDPLPREQIRAHLVQVQQLAQSLMAQHGLHEWKFGFNRRKRSMGLCREQHRRIEVSVHYAIRNDLDHIRDTVLHEIAHALVGAKHHHDAVWKQKCVEIGAVPQRCGHADMPRGRWHAQCPKCGVEFYRHRRPQRFKYYCPPCGVTAGKLTWTWR